MCGSESASHGACRDGREAPSFRAVSIGISSDSGSSIAGIRKLTTAFTANTQAPHSRAHMRTEPFLANLLSSLTFGSLTPSTNASYPTVVLDDATIIGKANGSVTQFLGIPFAQPPYVPDSLPL